MSSVQLDPEALVKRMGGNRALVAELVEIFQQEGPKNLETIRDGIARNDAPAVRIGSHTLKGSLSYFPVPPALELAEKLEKMGRTGTLDGAADICCRLETLVRSMVDNLHALQFNGTKTT
jgi:two-component system, sensor histidine kinase and response regulator